MHEMSLVRPVMEAVLDACEGNPIKSVKTVHLTIGAMHDVVDEYIPGLFQFLARGTIAEHADVIIERVPMRVRCNQCGEIWEIDVRDDSTWVCPRCGVRQDYRLFTGNEFRIDSIEVEAGMPDIPEAAPEVEDGSPIAADTAQ